MKPLHTSEFKLTALREIAPPGTRPTGDTPAAIYEYWQKHIDTSPCYRPEVENAVVVLLNTRRKITGHMIISQGTLDTLLVHPRQVFTVAFLANAAAVVFCHNHPSGDPTPSEADIKVTRDLIRAGQLLRTDLCDSLVIGHPANQPPFISLRELGYFYS